MKISRVLEWSSVSLNLPRFCLSDTGISGRVSASPILAWLLLGPQEDFNSIQPPPHTQAQQLQEMASIVDESLKVALITGQELAQGTDYRDFDYGSRSISRKPIHTSPRILKHAEVYQIASSRYKPKRLMKSQVMKRLENWWVAI